MSERVWYVFTDNQGHFTVAKQATGAFMFPVAGPISWEEAAAIMRSKGIPNW